MKNFKRILRISFTVLCTLGIVGSVALAALAPGAINLGSAANFALLSGSGIVDSNVSDITGHVGASPITGAAIGIPAVEVTGTIYAVDAAGPLGSVEDPALLILAKSAVSTAYTATIGAGPATSVTASTTDSFAGTGYTLLPGVYNSASTMGVPIALTLDGGGDPNAVFIFQAGSTLTTVAGSTITLINGAQACNIFWAAGSSVTFGSGSDFVGTVMAVASITDAGDSTILGRLLADADNDDTGAVTLNFTTVTVPTCAPSLTLVKEVDNTGGGAETASVWTLTATGSGGSPTNLSGSTGVDSDTVFSSGTFKVGTYTLAESSTPSGYTASTYSCIKNGGGAVVSNSITLAADDDAVCTITNTYVPPQRSSSRVIGYMPSAVPATLYVIKQVVNDNGGTAAASAFTLHVKNEGVDVTGSPATGIAVPGTAYTLASGDYRVSEIAYPGYTATFSGDCDANGRVTLTSGDEQTCIVTNNDNTPLALAVSTFPSFPKTGLPPQSGSTPWNMIIPGGILFGMLVLFVARKKHII